MAGRFPSERVAAFIGMRSKGEFVRAQKNGPKLTAEVL